MISTKIKNKIQKILNAIETGSPEGDYSNISLYHDGPNKIKQITYGKSQTTEWGNLSKLIDLYIEKKGQFANDLCSYQGKIGKISLVDDANLLSILKKAGKDPVMVQAQDEFFDEHYWKPAKTWFDAKGFTLPFSMLVIYDSFIQSGSMLKFLRYKFPETTPVNGGNEKVWIQQYVNVRNNWLSNHSEKILVNSAYRTRNLLKGLKEENWMLDKTFEANDCKIS
jgi:chitosanase